MPLEPIMLAQEPELVGETVQESIDAGVAQGRALLARFDEISNSLSEPLEPDAMEAAMAELTRVQESIEAANLWELDRIVDRAMQQLRCPPPDALVSKLSGGERRRVAVAVPRPRGLPLALGHVALGGG